MFAPAYMGRKWVFECFFFICQEDLPLRNRPLHTHGSAFGGATPSFSAHVRLVRTWGTRRKFSSSSEAPQPVVQPGQVRLAGLVSALPAALPDPPEAKPRQTATAQELPAEQPY